MRCKPKCRVCGAKMLPIVYGLPGPKMIKEAMRGKIALGGCVIEPGNPKWECPKCEVLL